MRRRGQSGEGGFGSDSFLDIVANIVGILIILIVVAGVRVSRTPVADAPAADPKRAAAENDELPAVAARESTPDEAAKTSEPVPPSPPPQDEPAKTDAEAVRLSLPEPPPLPELEPDPQPVQRPLALMSEARRLEDSVESIEATIAERKSAIRKLEVRGKQVDSQLRAENREVKTLAAAFEKEKTALQRLNDEIQRQKRDIAGIDLETDTLKQQDAPVKRIEHRLTPISRVVVGDEVHFRIAEGRISKVPINALIDELKADVKSRKQSLARISRSGGVVGPVDGYSMKYRVQRVSADPGLEFARGYVRISVTKWELESDDDLRTESVSEALRSDSLFLQALRAATPGTTLTFWVYPDSFGAYRRFQKVAHEAGFQVAGRPLPEGVPIAGSPQGTRSAGQ